MDNDNTQTLLDKVNELHTALIGTEHMPGAIPRGLMQTHDHEIRIRRLETWRNICVGGGLLIIFCLKYIAPLLMTK